VAWVWGPNWYSLPNLPWNDMRSYYPGDQYVDWVAISGYGDSHLTPDTVYDNFYNIYAGRKPLMIAESGVLDRGGTTKPDWIDALDAWVRAHPAIAAVVWYDTDHSPGTTENFRLDSTAGSLEAFKRLASDPYFSG
jgi:beta-mannanase